MITCDKCGFGHKTFEEKRACKSWDEIAAEMKAGARRNPGACGERGHAMSKKITDYDSAFAACEYALENISDFEGWCAAQERPKVKAKHLKAATKTLIGYVAENLSGSPRKVGEDGQQTFEQWWASINKFATDSDRLDHTIWVLGRPFMARKEAAELAWHAALARPSSVAVGEQKQEEGV